MKLSLLLFTLAAAPLLASAALFPADTKVKMIDAKGFKKAMKQNVTSVVAFVAPWCGHCQRMAPEYSKAAVALTPMVPLYAVDCDNESNKRLCGEQGVQGFPTVKLFPRGGSSKPVSFDGPERTSKAFFYWASQHIPHGVKRIDTVDKIASWSNDNLDKPRAILLNPGKEIPLLWKSLGNKYKHAIFFAIHRDKSGKSAVKLGAESEPSKGSRILVYPPGSTKFIPYEGEQKYAALSKFFASVVDGTAKLSVPEDPPADTNAEEKAQVHFEAAHSSSAVPEPAATPAAASAAEAPSPEDRTSETGGAEAEGTPKAAEPAEVSPSQAEVMEETEAPEHLAHPKDEL